jgi:peroxiredoxin
MWRSILPWIALLAASTLVAVLGWQNRGLRADRDWLTDRVSYAYPGMYVPLVKVRSVDGEAFELGAPRADYQVLYFFTHTCPYCRQSAPAVAETARTLQNRFGARVSMLGICQCTDDQAREYAKRHGFGFPVIAMNDRRNVMLYRARIVPVLLAVDRDGRVRHVAQGVFGSKEQTRGLVAALQNRTSL